MSRTLLRRANQTYQSYEEQDMNKESWNGWALDYPDDYPCAEAYTPLKNFIDYCATTSDDDFIAGIGENFYLQNFIDYQVFLMSQGLRDNNMKNTFLSLVDKNESKQMMHLYITPLILTLSLSLSSGFFTSSSLRFTLSVMQ